MKTVIALLVSMLGFVSEVALAENLVVVVHPSNPLTALTRPQLSDLFLGRGTTFPDGQRATIVEQARDSRTRESFFRLVNGMSLNQVNTYWARLTFSGRINPPTFMTDGRGVLRTVATNPEAIGYVDAGLVDESVRVLLDLRE
ncbi:MAG: substrate-binding domain-containing protein [Magnetococcales bacterium]|nr:substrate-binding domain-containing protein [Magnetococcales bacterium]MBF0262173.1 substrate-binding domain-containing protein [Magnetococcales bacterium]